MIFDCDLVTTLFEEWRISKSNGTLDNIVNESRSLVEVIVSRYPSEYRDDMIQECFIRIPFALGHFNPDIANLHSYFTSVFTNCCNTYISKESRERRLSDILEDLYEPSTIDIRHEDSILEELIIRNRDRFPTIETETLDSATCYIFGCIMDGVYGKSRGAIANLMRLYGFRRNVATIIYHSSLIYMRLYYEGFVDTDYEEPGEFSLLSELKDVLGEEAYARISTIFSGLYFKVP